MTLFIYCLLMAGVTYLIRAIPFSFFTKKIKNKYIRSFFYYVPYAVLSAMTFPAILYSTGNVWSAVVGTLLALALSFFNLPLIVVSLSAAAIVFIFSFFL